ncbi:2-aminoethylphosphonate--pyruvate transaminase [Lichenicoccus sp.]|uniref:2-aminoethylphosphonate--pyruvate transaminase n=1 Tax=Lichenicoccus sp. TaxID=2781899 RepID=UPI003D1479B7
MRTLLLTPGPLTTSEATRSALGRDWGSRDPAFVALTTRLRQRLAAVVHGEATHEAVLLAGSGTFAIEAAIGTLVPRDGRLLVLANGAYGERMAAIARQIGRAHAVERWPETAPVDPDRVRTILREDPSITDVAIVQCETTTGLLNPIGSVSDIVATAGRRLLIDAMSGFGALPLDLRRIRASAVMASSNKCLEGVPGIAVVVAERQQLAQSAGQSHSLGLDLHAQWHGFAANGQWRFTPPVQVAAALDAALDQLDAEGGPAARLARYLRLHAMLTAGMARLGYRTTLPPALQAPIIVTFDEPGPEFDFARFYAALQADGIVIYPGKLTRAPSFRIGCIGAIDQHDIARALESIARITVWQGEPAGSP